MIYGFTYMLTLTLKKNEKVIPALSYFDDI